MGSAEARKLDERAAALQENYALPGRFLRRNDDIAVFGPLSLFDAISTIARKGLTMQRYKGLGEMTAEQLWETTLDRNVRSLLQVKLKDVTEAEDIFVRLMGDVWSRAAPSSRKTRSRSPTSIFDRAGASIRKRCDAAHTARLLAYALPRCRWQPLPCR